jgi:hypothetical protein
MNSNATITSIVARYLSNANFRKNILVDTEQALTTCGLVAEDRREFSKFDFRGLESFGGLITKTQHNFLYEYLPYTRQLLRIYRLDLTIFAAYRTLIQSTPAAAASRVEKTRRFVNYLSAWLGGRDEEFPGLVDLLEHEYILWDLKNEPHPDRTVSAVMPSPAAELRNAIASLRRGVKLAELRYKPLQMIDRLEQGTQPQRKDRCQSRLVYWIDTQRSEIRVAEMNRTVWKVIRLCDGKRRLPSLYKELAPLRPATVRQALAFAETSGFIIMGKPR